MFTRHYGSKLKKASTRLHSKLLLDMIRFAVLLLALLHKASACKNKHIILLIDSSAQLKAFENGVLDGGKYVIDWITYQDVSSHLAVTNKAQTVLEFDSWGKNTIQDANQKYENAIRGQPAPGNTDSGLQQAKDKFANLRQSKKLKDGILVLVTAGVSGDVSKSETISKTMKNDYIKIYGILGDNSGKDSEGYKRLSRLTTNTRVMSDRSSMRDIVSTILAEECGSGDGWGYGGISDTVFFLLFVIPSLVSIGCACYYCVYSKKEPIDKPSLDKETDVRSFFKGWCKSSKKTYDPIRPPAPPPRPTVTLPMVKTKVKNTAYPPKGRGTFVPPKLESNQKNPKRTSVFIRIYWRVKDRLNKCRLGVRRFLGIEEAPNAETPLILREQPRYFAGFRKVAPKKQAWP